MTFQHWRVERFDDGVEVAAYRNDPMNYFFADGAAEFAELVGTWADPAVRAVVITGDVPGKFLTHYSVEELVSVASDREALPTVCPQLTDGYHALLEQMRFLPKPIIVAMTGDTMGGGFELSMAADIRIAEDGPYRIGLLETKLGIIPGGSGTQRLARMLGPAAAVEIVMRGRVFTPQQAASRGLVHEAVPDAKARALEIAHELAAMSAIAVAEAKRSVYAGVDMPLADGLKVETDAFLATMASDEGLDLMRQYVATPLEERASWAQPE
jgi:enoyl-CoA hydratase/carnithine racemase